VTSAPVGEISVTLVTFADAPAARPDLAWALMTGAKACPSCSRRIRSATGPVACRSDPSGGVGPVPG